MKLPPLPTVSDAERALLERKRLLERAWRASPYFLPLPSAKTGAPSRCACALEERPRGCGCCCAVAGTLLTPCAAAAAVDDGVERYSDRYKPQALPGRAPLSAFLTLDARYFPAELYRRKGAGAGRGGAPRGRGAEWLAAEGAAGGDMLRLERLAEAERRAAERGDAAGGGGGEEEDDEDAIRAPGGATKRPRRVAAGGEDDEDGGEGTAAAGAEGGEGADEEAADEEEDADDEDDYGAAAGGAFDDDDDYADDLGGGGDDDGGATY